VNRWGARILALFMLLMFLFLFWNLKKQLVMMQRLQGKPAAAPAQSR
jgi:hypothetical protein